jgi:hypothetical protein
VALALTALMTMIAAGIDLSVVYNWRRADQNGADHAALAAAWASCHGNDPTTAGLLAAADNGFDNDGVSNTVSVTNVGTHRYRVVISSSVDALFAGVIGIDRLRASARAVAACTQATSGSYAMFAGSTTCGPKTLDWPGSSSTMTGRIHSNDGLYIGGTSNVVDGATTYVSDVNVNAGNQLDPPPSPSEVLPLPVNFDIAAYAPGGSKAVLAGSSYHSAGSSKIDTGWLSSQGLLNTSTGELAAGLYYTTGDIDVSTSNLTGTATFVTSSGIITLSGSGQNLTPWDPDDLLLFSNNDTACFDPAIKVDGSNSVWRGIVYAPLGMIEMPGSDNSSILGSLIGDTIRLNGSMLGITAHDACCEGPPTLTLEE